MPTTNLKQKSPFDGLFYWKYKMNELTTLPPPTLEIIDGVPTVLSTVVADYFGYRHDNLLQIIRGLIARNSELLCLLYFQETTTSRPHPKNPDVFIESPAFRMNQTGFNILAMKLSGKRAERYQIRFAQAFEAAVKALQNINLSTFKRPYDWRQSSTNENGRLVSAPLLSPNGKMKRK
jgi:Rha family phage regulatory protein